MEWVVGEGGEEGSFEGYGRGRGGEEASGNVEEGFSEGGNQV